VAQARPQSLYVDCRQVPHGFDPWLSRILGLLQALHDRVGKLVLCAAPDALRQSLAISQLDTLLAVRKEEVPPGRLHLPEPSWLTWNDGTVPRLAHAIRTEGAFDRMPVLADALEEAGCTDADILGHCRSGVPHRPDCWVLGMLAVEA
jgi:hypothetical protein